MGIGVKLIGSEGEKRRKAKYYFRGDDDELCYPLERHVENAKEDGIEELELWEAEPERFESIFWCKAVLAVTEEGHCGKECEDYTPKNGRSGMCIHKGNFYTHGEKVKIKIGK